MRRCAVGFLAVHGKEVMMLRIFSMQMKKLLCSPLFYASVIAITVMCFCAPLHRNEQTGNSDSVLSCMLQYTKEEMVNEGVMSDFSLYHVFLEGMNGWALMMFIPVIAAIAAVNVFCDERNSREKREILIRSGQKQYIAGSSLFFMVSGGLVCLSGYALYFLIAGFFFPHMASFPAGEVSMYFDSMLWPGSAAAGLYASCGLWAVYALKLFLFFVYGTLMVLPALVLAGFLRNKYLIVCIPFFLKYIQDSASSLLFSREMLSGNPRYGQFGQLVSSSLVLGLENQKEGLWKSVFTVVFEMAVLLVLFAVFEKKGADKGE